MEGPSRPDGSIASVIGWFLVIVGLIAGFVAANADSFEGMIIGLAICNLAIGLGVLLLSLGYLVRAISFLPGRAMPPEALASAVTVDCDWCGQSVRKPNEPCASVDVEKLRGIAPTIANPRCRQAFSERRLLDATDVE